VQISSDLYSNIREFLLDSKESDSDTIESLVDKAVRNFLLRKTITQIQEEMAPQVAHLSEEELMDEINAVITEVRAEAACAQR
jgi:hypothetical protein